MERREYRAVVFRKNKDSSLRMYFGKEPKWETIHNEKMIVINNEFDFYTGGVRYLPKNMFPELECGDFIEVVLKQYRPNIYQRIKHYLTTKI